MVNYNLKYLHELQIFSTTVYKISIIEEFGRKVKQPWENRAPSKIQ